MRSVPAISMRTNGGYTHAPDWYRNFLYAEERARGLDFSEDLASPGTLRFDLSRGEGVWLMAAEGHEAALGAGPRRPPSSSSATPNARGGPPSPDRSSARPTPTSSAAASGRTIVAGYPWFTDWGRDTFIALRGLLPRDRAPRRGAAGSSSSGPEPSPKGCCPTSSRTDGAARVQLGRRVALVRRRRVTSTSQARAAAGRRVEGSERTILQAAFGEILTGYARGTRFGIRADEDGLLAAGEPGVQLTWMDAKVGDWVVTPRIGKPVEIQALWINALRIADALHRPVPAACSRRPPTPSSAASGTRRAGCLYDVVDPDHRPGTADATLRPNQIFAVGGLPFPLLDGGARPARRRRGRGEALDAARPAHACARTTRAIAAATRADLRERDGAYHQGTVWPWLLGRVRRGLGARARRRRRDAPREARARFLEPLSAHLDEAGLGHVSEIADGDAPHTPRGCPFQAWSVGEMLRLDRAVLSDSREDARMTSSNLDPERVRLEED